MSDGTREPTRTPRLEVSETLPDEELAGGQGSAAVGPDQDRITGSPEVRRKRGGRGRRHRGRGDRGEALARAISAVLSPVHQVFFMLIAVGVQAAGVARGLALGAVAALFTAGVPWLVLEVGVRRGTLSDADLSRREERPAMMAIGLVSVSAGLGAMALMGAPLELFALVGAMVAGIAVALLVTLFWKISIHASVTAGSATILIIVFGPWALLAAPLVVAVAWARVRVGAHTMPQVLVGAAVGAAVAYAAFTTLS